MTSDQTLGDRRLAGQDRHPEEERRLAGQDRRPEAEERRSAGENRRLGALLRSAATDLVALVRGEVSLARSEAKDTMRQVIVALVSLVAGALIAFAALLVLLQALVIALSHVMPPWAASLLVGVVVAIIGFILIYKGESDLSAAELAPTRTAKSVRKDANLLKEQVT